MGKRGLEQTEITHTDTSSRIGSDSFMEDQEFVKCEVTDHARRRYSSLFFSRTRLEADSKSDPSAEIKSVTAANASCSGSIPRRSAYSRLMTEHHGLLRASRSFQRFQPRIPRDSVRPISCTVRGQEEAPALRPRSRSVRARASVRRGSGTHTRRAARGRPIAKPVE